MSDAESMKREFTDRLMEMRRQLDERNELATGAGQDKAPASETRFQRLFEIAQAMSDLQEMMEPYKRGHHRRVADLAGALAAAMSLPEERVQGIRLAGLLHDIGKISIQAELLNKPMKLNDQEFQLMKTHVQSGYDLLKEMPFPWPIAKMVQEHHERVDGSGYPCGLRGEQVLPDSRILVVADVVDAIASRRTYRPAFTLETALYDLSGNKGSLYDIDVVNVCLRLFNEDGYQMLDIEE